MSDQSFGLKAFTRLGERTAEMAVEAVWRQWSVLNPLLGTHRPSATGCLLDPETLVLASLVLAEREARLVDLLAWWAQRGSLLLSVQRMRTLLKEFSGAERPLGWFAHWATHLGGDGRWKGMAEETETPAPRPGKGPEVLRFDHLATLMLKLRAGFGVGVKADLLAYLLSLRGEARAATEIARAIGYTSKTVRIAVRDLGLAGFVEETGEYPARFATPPKVAESLLALMYGGRKQTAPPRWCYWAQVLSFLLRVAELGSELRSRSDLYVASSRARDLFAKYEAVFRAIGVRMPRPEPYPGATYLAPFDEFVAELGSWLDRDGKGM